MPKKSVETLRSANTYDPDRFPQFRIEVVGCALRPEDSLPVLPENSRVLYLVDGPGFGSGKHPTTRCCMMFLRKILRLNRPRKVLDAGCGNGILAICAAMLGARRVIAEELLPEAAETARRNIRLNGVGERVCVYCGNSACRQERCDLIVANPNPRQVLRLGVVLANRLRQGGYYILSGLSGFNRDRMVRRLSAVRGLRLVEERYDRGWTTLLFHRQGMA